MLKPVPPSVKHLRSRLGLVRAGAYVRGMTDDELEHARRLVVSLTLAVPGSAVREPIPAHIRAIDAELAERASRRPAT